MMYRDVLLLYYDDYPIYMYKNESSLATIEYVMNVYGSSAPNAGCPPFRIQRTNSCPELNMHPVDIVEPLPMVMSDSALREDTPIKLEMIAEMEEHDGLIKTHKVKHGNKKRMLEIPKLNLKNIHIDSMIIPVDLLSTRSISVKKIFEGIYQEDGHKHFKVNFPGVNFVVHRRTPNIYAIDKCINDKHIYRILFHSYEYCYCVLSERNAGKSFDKSDFGKYMVKKKRSFLIWRRNKMPKPYTLEEFSKIDMACNQKIHQISQIYSDLCADAGSCIRGFDIEERNGSVKLVASGSVKTRRNRRKLSKKDN